MDLYTSIKSSAAYAVFLYQQELKRSKRRDVKLKKTKIMLTDKLITKGVKNVKQLSFDDLKAMNREMVYKKKLMMQVHGKRKTEKKSRRKATSDIKKTEQTEE